MNRYSMKSDSVVSELNEFSASELLGRTRISKINDNYIKDKLAKIFYDSIFDFFNQVNLDHTRDCVNDFFFKYIPTIPTPLFNQSGSTSLIGLLPIYLLARTINPKMILESGVFIGSSLHLFSTVFQKIPIYAFDINLRRLSFQPNNVLLNEMDWAEFSDLPRHNNSLVFFDDHINCAKRVLECHKRGIQWAIFDDSPSVGRLERYRYPAVPSIPMIMDELLPDNCTFEWHHKSSDTKLFYQHNLSDCQKARAVIKKYVSLDMFSEITGVSSGDKWAVEIES